MTYDYDLFVIGAGSGGVRAARVAAGLGKKVAIAEDRQLGGTCVNVGCVPKKLFVYGSHFHEDFDNAKAYGWTSGDASFDWPTLRDNKTREIERLNGIYGNLLDNAGVELINGRAELTGANTVMVGGQEYSAERILVAVGGWPFVPEFPGSEHAITSNEAFYLDEFPGKAIVVGGGYIAVEFAGIFQGLGAETDLLYRRDLFLRGFDHDIRTFVADEVAKKGIGLHFNTDIERIEKLENGQLRAHLKDGKTMDADTILYATGRVPKTTGLGLDAAGVATQPNGAIIVDDYFQTSVPSIYALGDVIDRVQLTPVAITEAMQFVGHTYQGERDELDYSLIPTAVFCQPNIGTVGVSEEQAREQHDEVKVYRSEFRPLKHTLSGSSERCLMKMITAGADERVVGIHMAGADSGEIIQGMAVAVQMGATKADFDRTIGIHPTSAEEFVTMRDAS